ncbi:membrane-associated protein, putative, partial [Bodo saltans]
MMGINCLNHRICLLSTTSPRSSLVDHLWLETFFCCPSTPPPSSYLPLVVGGVVGGVLGGVALSVSAVPLLGVLGFSSVGVGVGSIAATLQTSQVVAGSWFALCQSAGALGVASGPIVVAASSTGAVIGGGLGAAVARVPPTISSLLDSYDDLVGAA